MDVPQLVITTAALVMAMTPLLVVAFVAGRRSARTRTLPQFDRLPLDPVRITGNWRAEFDGLEPGTFKIVEFQFHQSGSRIIATGHESDGTKHFLEGVLFEGRLCGVCIQEIGSQTSIGTLTAEFSPSERTFTGMRSFWSSQLQALTVRKAVFTNSLS
jgi:hypothetical protein